jgi:hypothetical protein
MKLEGGDYEDKCYLLFESGHDDRLSRHGSTTTRLPDLQWPAGTTHNWGDKLAAVSL